MFGQYYDADPLYSAYTYLEGFRHVIDIVGCFGTHKMQCWIKYFRSLFISSRGLVYEFHVRKDAVNKLADGRATFEKKDWNWRMDAARSQWYKACECDLDYCSISRLPFSHYRLDTAIMP